MRDLFIFYLFLAVIFAHGESSELQSKVKDLQFQIDANEAEIDVLQHDLEELQ